MNYNSLKFTEIKVPTVTGTEHGMSFIVLHKPAHSTTNSVNLFNLPVDLPNVSAIIDDYINGLITSIEIGFVAGLKEGLKDKDLVERALAGFKSENCFCIHISFNRISDDSVVVTHDVLVEKLDSFKSGVALSLVKKD